MGRHGPHGGREETGRLLCGVAAAAAHRAYNVRRQKGYYVFCRLSEIKNGREPFVIASDRVGVAGRGWRWPLPDGNRGANRIRKELPLVSYPRGREGREEEKDGGNIILQEDDEGKMEDNDDAVDPRGTTAQITGQRQAEASKEPAGVT